MTDSKNDNVKSTANQEQIEAELQLSTISACIANGQAAIHLEACYLLMSEKRRCSAEHYEDTTNIFIGFLTCEFGIEIPVDRRR